MTMTPRTVLSALIVAVATSLTIGAQSITSKDLLDGLSNTTRWLSHSGDYSGQRFSPLTQITPANASQLAAQWTFQTGVVNKFEATPIVLDGVLAITGALNHAWALDARTGRQIWHYQRTLPEGPRCAEPSAARPPVAQPFRAAGPTEDNVARRRQPSVRSV
jgi:alcohol dehydrogenase (cytochrome c)